MIHVTVLVLLIMKSSPCFSDNAQSGEQTEVTGQGFSLYIMREVFKLEGILQEIKTTQLQKIEEDIEELRTKIQNGKKADQSQDLEDLRKDMEAIKHGNEVMKAQFKTVTQQIETIKSLNIEGEIFRQQQKYSLLQKSIEELQIAVTRQQSSGNGVTYVRWGRTSCPGSSEKVYTGYVGGGHYKHSGSGANWLCLTDSPQWGHYEDNVDSGAKVYGGEYEFGDRQKNGGSGFFGQNLNDQDALCVVCRPPRSSIVMIPGRRSCTPGWTFEYRGYLVADYYSHSASTFICLDERPEPRAGSNHNNDGKTFYMAEGICGSLPCPPYINGRQITCVVCSK